jgi:hypothetical protein
MNNVMEKLRITRNADHDCLAGMCLLEVRSELLQSVKNVEFGRTRRRNADGSSCII